MTGWWRRLICRIFFHQMVVVHRCTKEAHKLRCLRCGRYFGIHHGLRICIPWSPGLCVCEDGPHFTGVKASIRNSEAQCRQV